MNRSVIKYFMALIALFLLYSCELFTPDIPGESISEEFHSELLGTDYQLYIHIPDDRSNLLDSRPLLLVLDGDETNANASEVRSGPHTLDSIS